MSFISSRFKTKTVLDLLNSNKNFSKYSTLCASRSLVLENKSNFKNKILPKVGNNFTKYMASSIHLSAVNKVSYLNFYSKLSIIKNKIISKLQPRK